MIVGITGTNGSGKDTVADYLVKKGFTHHSLSDILREELAKEGKKESRENMANKSKELREKYGLGVLSKRVLETIKKNKEKNCVVVSIRKKEEAEVFKNHGDSLIISVDAPLKERYMRISKRQREGDKFSFEEFCKIDNIETKGKSKYDQKISEVMAIADVTIVNNSTLIALYDKIEEVLRLHKMKN